jgi:hypothetical protein
LTVRTLLAATCALATVLSIPAQAAAQRRVAVPRRAVVVRPSVVVRARPTVFVGGFYYPSFYRANLYYGYGGYYDRYYGSYYGGWPSYQFPPYYGYARYDLSGTVRTQVAPRQTEVFIDGYYAGTVDDFELLAPGEAEPARPAGAPLPPTGTRDPRYGAGGPPGDPRAGGPPPRPSGVEARGPSPAAQGFGQLSLRVQPADAEVLIDGEKWEGGLNGERLDVQLGTGLHRLEVRKAGYRNYFTDVTIINGQTRTLNVALTKQ